MQTVIINATRKRYLPTHKNTMKFTVDDNLAGKTLKQYFAEQGYSTTQIKRYKYGGEILVNGTPQTVRYTLQKGDEVILVTAERLQTPAFAQQEAKVLFADRWLYVAEKPYGLPIHPDRAHRDDTFGNRLATTFGQGFCLRIVTRLDKTTSGLVLGAFDEITAQKLNEMQQKHAIEKTYLARVNGTLPTPSGKIDLSLLREDKTNKTVVSERGKAATTLWQVLCTDEKSTLLEVTPLTGRTHQIRAHLSAIGHPIVGDELYGGSPSQRVMLHCHRLKFTHPVTGEIVDIVSQEDFAARADG